MLAAAEATGFFYISGHGVAQGLIDEVFATSRAFIAADLQAKRAVAVNAFAGTMCSRASMQRLPIRKSCRPRAAL